MRRDRIFISYAHEDTEVAEALELRLNAFAACRGRVFRDDAIDGGDAWLERLEREISVARVVVMLVSPAFVTSRFIREKELPAIMRLRDKAAQLHVLSVKLAPVEPPEELRVLQGFANGRPLSTRDAGEREEVLQTIAERVRDIVDQGQCPRDDMLATVRRLASNEFDLHVDRELARGSQCFVYVARELGGRWVVKARAPHPVDVDAGDEVDDVARLERNLEAARRLRHPALGEGDAETLEAWRRTLRSGIAYMSAEGEAPRLAPAPSPCAEAKPA